MVLTALSMAATWAALGAKVWLVSRTTENVRVAGALGVVGETGEGPKLVGRTGEPTRRIASGP